MKYLGKLAGAALLSTTLLVVGNAQAAPVSVDGNLADIIAAQSESLNSAQKSDGITANNDGADISNIYFHYDQYSDTFYFGIAVWGQVGNTDLAGFFTDLNTGAFDFLENTRVLLDLNSDGSIDFEYSLAGDGVANSGPNTEGATIVTNLLGLPAGNFSSAVSESLYTANGFEFSITGAGFFGDVTVSLGTGSGNGFGEDLVTLNATVVPVPAAVWLFGSGLLALVGFGRSQRS